MTVRPSRSGRPEVQDDEVRPARLPRLRSPRRRRRPPMTSWPCPRRNVASERRVGSSSSTSRIGGRPAWPRGSSGRPSRARPAGRGRSPARRARSAAPRLGRPSPRPGRARRPARCRSRVATPRPCAAPGRTSRTGAAARRRGTPGPAVLDRQPDACRPSRIAPRSAIGASGPPYLAAFSSVFARTWPMNTSSTRTGGRSSRQTSMVDRARRLARPDRRHGLDRRGQRARTRRGSA